MKAVLFLFVIEFFCEIGMAQSPSVLPILENPGKSDTTSNGEYLAVIQTAAPISKLFIFNLKKVGIEKIATIQGTFNTLTFSSLNDEVILSQGNDLVRYNWRTEKEMTRYKQSHHIDYHQRLDSYEHVLCRFEFSFVGFDLQTGKPYFSKYSKGSVNLSHDSKYICHRTDFSSYEVFAAPTGQTIVKGNIDNEKLVSNFFSYNEGKIIKFKYPPKWNWKYLDTRTGKQSKKAPVDIAEIECTFKEKSVYKEGYYVEGKESYVKFYNDFMALNSAVLTQQLNVLQPNNNKKIDTGDSIRKTNHLALVQLVENNKRNLAEQKSSENNKPNNGEIDGKESSTYQLVVQIGHAGEITEFGISDDKKHCVTGSSDNTVILWDVEKCKVIRSFIGHQGEILGVAISNDKRYVASTSASSDYDLKLWNALTGDSIYTLRSPPRENFEHLAITPDNKYIICSKGSKIEVLDLLSGKLVKTLNGHSDDVNSVRCSPDGKYFLTGGEDKKMILWDAEKLSKKKSFSEVKSEVNNVGFSTDGTVVFCNADRSNYIFDIETGKKIGEVGYGSQAGDLSADKKYMIANYLVWDVVSGQKIFELQESSRLGARTVTAFGPDGKTIVSAYNRSLALLEAGTGKILKKTGGVNKIICGGAFFTPDMRELFHGDTDGKLLFWNLQDLVISRFIKGNDKEITSIAMTNDHSKILVAGKDGFTRLYDTKEFKSRSSHSSGDLYPYEVAISPDGTRFATVKVTPDWNSCREIEVAVDLAVGRSVRQIYTTRKSHVAFSGDNEYLFCAEEGSSSVSAFLISGDLFSKTRHLNHKWGVNALATSVDGKLLLSGSNDKTMKLWDTQKSKMVDMVHNTTTYECIRTFEGQHSGSITAVALSNNGMLAVSGSSNRLVIVWDVETGEPLWEFAGHGGTILSVKFSADDKYVISSAAERSIRIWNIETGQWTSFITSGDNQQWLVFNSEGYWDASPNGGDFVAMVNGVETWNIDQFAVKNNRPDLILSGLGSPNTSLIEHYKKQYIKRLRKLGINETNLSNTDFIPTASITSITTEGAIATVNALFVDKNSELKRYNLFINDVPILGTLGKEITGNEKAISESIPLCAGQNKVEVSCINSNGVESYRALTYVNNSATHSRNLYLLAFGVSKYKNSSLNLQYAHKDALDLEKVMQTYKGKGFENVYTKVLTNEQVTPEAIKASKDFVKNAKPDDTFILFIAGHGMHDRDAEATYYFLTHNTDLKNLKGTAADFETIEDLLQGIPPRNKLFLMDACESGEIDEEDQGQMIAAATGAGIASRGFKTVNQGTSEKAQGISGKRAYLYQKDRYIYNDLVRRSGAIVFSSSKGGELSYERSDIENGLFTEYIMKALTTVEADKDNNGFVSTDELRQYVSEQVAKASGDLQHPTVDRDNLYQKFGFPVK